MLVYFQLTKAGDFARQFSIFCERFDKTNHLQVEVLSGFRDLRGDSANREQVAAALPMSMNCIATGLGGTG